MSTSHIHPPSQNGNSPQNGTAALHGHASRVRLHRLKQVRREQGVSTRRIAQHLRVDALEVARQEDPTVDLSLSQLYKWQQVLEVPVCDLLVDSDSPLSPPVLERARMVRLMKTAAAIFERADTSTMRRLAERLIGQLKEIMPELEGIAPWSSESHRQRSSSKHRIGHRVFSSDGWREG